MNAPATHDLEARARWHLELGYELPAHVIFSLDNDEDGWDEDDGHLNCTRCGGEAWTEVDDPMWDKCDEFGYGPCPACRGTGERRHQWVF